jgi:hypothetical protein
VWKMRRMVSGDEAMSNNIPQSLDQVDR